MFFVTLRMYYFLLISMHSLHYYLDFEVHKAISEDKLDDLCKTKTQEQKDADGDVDKTEGVRRDGFVLQYNAKHFFIIVFLHFAVLSTHQLSWRMPKFPLMMMMTKPLHRRHNHCFILAVFAIQCKTFVYCFLAFSCVIHPSI